MLESIFIDYETIRQRAFDAMFNALWYKQFLDQHGYHLVEDPGYRKLLIENGLLGTIPSQINVPDDAIPQDKPNIFHQLQNALDDGTYREKFPVGTILPDIWTDLTTGTTYDMPLRIVHYGEVTLTSGKKCLGATLQRVHASPNRIVFGRESKDFPYGNSRYNISDANVYLNMDDESSYLSGCSADLRNSVAEVVLSVPAPNGSVDRVNSKFFLPSPEELHYDIENLGQAQIDLLAWEYFRDTPTDMDTPCKKRIFRTPNGSAQFCLLRSAYRGYVHFACGSATNGSASRLNADGAYSCAPVCVIIGTRQ